MGRARNSREKEKAEKDIRNILYIEYLEIVAKHQPAVFIMENVKGMLSSKVDGHSVFDRIVSDLEQPSKDIKYRIFSIVKRCSGTSCDKVSSRDYIVECEKYGIPQARHRVILLGIREDLAQKTEPGILNLQEEVTLTDVLFGLPKLRSGLSKNLDAPHIWAQLVREGLGRRWVTKSHKKAGEQVKKTVVRSSRICCRSSF
nr:DNA cytosine methyltransferase [Geobacter sp. OR-1]